MSHKCSTSYITKQENGLRDYLTRCAQEWPPNKALSGLPLSGVRDVHPGKERRDGASPTLRQAQGSLLGLLPRLAGGSVRVFKRFSTPGLFSV